MPPEGTGNPSESLWSPNNNRNKLWKKGKLKTHYDKHGADFGASSSSEYSDMDLEFGTRESDSIIQAKNGAFVYKYEPSSNTVFVGTKKGGTIKTFYKWDGIVVIETLEGLGLLK